MAKITKTTKITMQGLAELLEKVQAQLTALSERVEQLEAAEPKQPAGNGAAARTTKRRNYGRRTDRHFGRAGCVPGRSHPHKTDSVAQLTRVGTAGTCVDPGVPLLA
jgi:hypothetical protein